MSQLRFDGKVVIITGAGGALGRAYALLFGSRGASVVVNDLCPPGPESPAQKVVDEIVKAGGKAVADYNSVEDGQKIVDTAITNFGRVDIIINNAGILRDTSFAKMTDAQWNIIMRVHLDGAYKVTKAAWPHMVKQKFGRVINTASAAGLYGNFGQANYSAAKIALMGFSNTLALEGKKYNINSNTIAPLAGSKMTETIMPPDLVKALKPDFVAPLVAFLCHESCKETGGVYELGAGWVAKLRWQRTKGEFFPADDSFTPEMVQQRWAKVVDFANPDYPTSTQDSMGPVLANLNNKSKADENKSAPASSSSSSNFQGAALFQQIAAVLKTDSSLVNEMKSVLVFRLKKGEESGVWTVDLKNDKGAVYEGEPKSGKADVEFVLSDADFADLISRKANPQNLFMGGKLKLKGNMGIAMKFEKVLKALESKQKSGTAPAAAAAPADSSSASGFKSAAVFDQLSALLKADGASVVQSMNSILTFRLNNNGQTGVWTMDLKNGTGAVYQGESKNGKADVEFTLSDGDFVGLVSRKANAQNLFMGGKLKLKGNMGVAMKFEKVVASLTPKAKL